MTLSEELKELEGLRERGVLNDAQFEQAKERVLRGELHGESGGANRPVPPPAEMQQYLNASRREAALMRLDREWAMEREKYMMTGRYGNRYLPTEGMSIGGGIAITVFGLIWTLMAAGITGVAGAASHGSGFPIFGFFSLFPLFGLVFIGVGIAASVTSYKKAQAYKIAEAAYQRRRAEILAGEDR